MNWKAVVAGLAGGVVASCLLYMGAGSVNYAELQHHPEITGHAVPVAPVTPPQSSYKPVTCGGSPDLSIMMQSNGKVNTFSLCVDGKWATIATHKKDDWAVPIPKKKRGQLSYYPPRSYGLNLGSWNAYWSFTYPVTGPIKASWSISSRLGHTQRSTAP